MSGRIIDAAAYDRRDTVTYTVRILAVLAAIFLLGARCREQEIARSSQVETCIRGCRGSAIVRDGGGCNVSECLCIRNPEGS